MGNIARHTDLSWELPGLRANVDVPLRTPSSGDTELRLPSTPGGFMHGTSDRGTKAPRRPG